jgi:osmotically-inducible protein OsmY
MRAWRGSCLHATPKGERPITVKRSDAQIREDVLQRLHNDFWIDARKVEVGVVNGDVTLNGSVRERVDRRHAEGIVTDVPGVHHVFNQIRVAHD